MKDICTSNLSKLLKHTTMLDDVNHKGIIRPVTLDINLTGYCNGTCDFCTQKNIERVHLPLGLAKKGLKMYALAGAEGLEITGGGEPLMYPEINEVIRYAKAYNYSIGLITNGLLLDRLTQESLNRLSWLRVSLNPIYHKGLEPPMKPEMHGVYGGNFVWERGMNEKELDWLIKAVEEKGFEYVKITPNVLMDGEWIETRVRTLEELINGRGVEDKLFVGSRILNKSSEMPKGCYAGHIKPHLNQNGKIYRCSCGSWESKKYTDHYMIADLNDPDFKVPIRPDDFDTSKCKFCHYADVNTLIELLLRNMRHKEFL